MGSADLKGWFAQLAAFDNPIRREFHLFTLLCGSRPTALQEAKPEHIEFRRRTAAHRQTEGWQEEGLRYSVVATDDPLPRPRNPI
jgi:hypothetical protein